jgi:peptide/nickel transport system ATP-binding protein
MLREGNVRAVDDVSFELNRGMTLGIVGESGSGKSSIALSIMRLLPRNARILGGQVIFDSEDILNLSQGKLNEIRWKGISMIPQGAMNAFDPVYTVGDQLVEAYATHESHKEARKRAMDVFDMVGLPASRMNDYPHKFSGGMKQRAMIALALICAPKLIIADEPTTALDVVMQDQILEQIKDLQNKLRMSLMLITHNISVVAETCDFVAIMYGGRIIEYADTVSLFKNSRHPYTLCLLRSTPSIHGKLSPLVSLPGTSPSLLNLPHGCRFSTRCPIAKEICQTNEPPQIEVARGNYSCCHFALDPILDEFKSNMDAGNFGSMDQD